MSQPGTNNRLQTRSTNADQHPGKVITRRKRRTQAEMKEDEEREDREKQELQKLRAEKVRDLAALEAKISKKDAQEVASTQTSVIASRPKPRPLIKKKVILLLRWMSFLINFDLCRLRSRAFKMPRS